MSEFTYETDPDFDYTIDEKGNAFIALRKIKWGNSDNFKLDIRKYYASAEGDKMQKGVSFLTDDGPNELARVLLKTGYGDAKEISDTIIESRPDIGLKLCKALDDAPELREYFIEASETYEDEESYDPEEILK